MTPEQFVYWLQGYAELTDCAELTAKQWDMVKEKLAAVSRANHFQNGNSWNTRPVLTPISEPGW